MASESEHQYEEMCRDIGNCFEQWGVERSDIQGLKGWKDYRGINGKRLFERIRTPTRRSPQHGTQKLIRDLYQAITRPHDNLELLDRLGIPEHRRVKILAGTPLPQPFAAETDSTASGPDLDCTYAVQLAGRGDHRLAHNHLKSLFRKYLNSDLPYSMALVPTLIYISYRYLSLRDIADAASCVLDGIRLSGKAWPFCEATVQRLCVQQLCCALCEHGEGNIAAHMLNPDEANSLLDSRIKLPWPRTPIMRNMAVQIALYESDASKALRWVERADEYGKDFNTVRGSAAMRYTIYMQLQMPQKALSFIQPQYTHSRTILLNAINSAHSRIGWLHHHGNAVYLGGLARSLSGAAYPPAELADDLLALNTCLKAFGQKQEMDFPKLMRIKASTLPPELFNLRTRVFRERFDEAKPELLQAVIDLMHVLENRKAP